MLHEECKNKLWIDHKDFIRYHGDPNNVEFVLDIFNYALDDPESFEGICESASTKIKPWRE